MKTIMDERKVQYNVLVKDNEDTVEIQGSFDTLEEAFRCLDDFVVRHNVKDTACELKDIGFCNYKSDNDNFHAYIERYVLSEDGTVYELDTSFDKVNFIEVFFRM